MATNKMPYRHPRPKSRKGASLPEYGILVALISIGTISSVLSVGDEIKSQFYTASQNISGQKNYIVNGSFEDLTGLNTATWGYNGSSIAGWTNINGNPLEINETGQGGMASQQGTYWLDTNASPAPVHIEQQVADLIPEETYTIVIYAGDRDPDLDGSVEVFWNNQSISTLTISTEDVMQRFEFDVQEGSGDGSNTLRLLDNGDNDAFGLSLDNIQLIGF
jgi:Flp pilus assembly pilin Flp